MGELLNQILLSLSKKGLSMKYRIAVRIVNALIVLVLYSKGGVDWVIVYSLIIVMADLDSIADKLEEKRKKND